MEAASAQLSVASDLRFLLGPRHRPSGRLDVALDGTSSLTHLVESVGIPRTEVGLLRSGGTIMARSHIPHPGEVIDVHPVIRPQAGADRGFLVDVGLGSLARHMRLVGLDTLYDNDAADVDLVEAAIATGRIVLTQDRGLLHRQALPAGALVRGQGAADQMDDVLTRFAPVLAPWTRCPTCNDLLRPVTKEAVARLLDPGTSATYSRFSQCEGCGRPYWRGAHGSALSDRVTRAQRLVTQARQSPR